MEGILIAKNCATCGREVFPTPQWVYKIRTRTNPVQYRYFCTYSCMCKDDEHIKEKTFTCKRKVQCYKSDGSYFGTYRGLNNAAESLGGSTEKIKEAIETGKMYLGFTWKYKEVTE